MRTRLLVALALISACEDATPSGSSDGATGTDSSTSSSSGMASQTSEPNSTSGSTTSDSGSASEDGSSTSDASSSSGSTTATSEASSSSTTGQPDVCGDGQVGMGEECDEGIATDFCDDDCTIAVCGDARVNAAAGEACDDGNVDETDGCRACQLPTCADGVLDPTEECDDGNAAAGDGCDPACKFERWEHFGVAHDVAVADLHGWTQCWSDDYSGSAKQKVSSLSGACTGGHLLMACGLVGSGVLTLAAHAPREDVMFPVSYAAGERHSANGVSWYWSPTDEHIGYGPAGNTTACIEGGEDEQMCIRTSGMDSNTIVTFGRRCGSKLGFSLADEKLWERVVFQAD